MTRMEPDVSTLSWSAVLAGWADMFLSVKDVRDLALDRILRVKDGERALVPLSDLASLADDEDRSHALGPLGELARLDGLPEVFARREWELYRLGYALSHLTDDLTPDEPGVWAREQVDTLTLVWRDLGGPLDWPLVNPYGRSRAEADYDEEILSVVLARLDRWAAQQHALLRVVRALLAEGGRAGARGGVPGHAAQRRGSAIHSMSRDASSSMKPRASEARSMKSSRPSGSTCPCARRRRARFSSAFTRA